LTGQNSRRRILVVDDNPDITFTVKAGLEANGLFEVDIFNDPEHAVSSFNLDYMTWHYLTLESQKCMATNCTMK
jgi:DNA-binding response OmpR family regulator